MPAAEPVDCSNHLKPEQNPDPTPFEKSDPHTLLAYRQNSAELLGAWRSTGIVYTTLTPML
jgi:hypothetical protein